MRGQIRAVTSSVIIHGQEFPSKSWTVRLGAAGSLATVSISTSLALLRASGLNVEKAALEPDGVPIDIYAGYEGEGAHVFGGVMETCRWSFREDSVTIEGIDHGVVLADSREAISKIDYRNQSIGQIVTAIAKEHGFNFEINDPGVKAGQELWGESAYIPNPQPWWSILQTLARQVGYEVHVTPEKSLFFGPSEAVFRERIGVIWGASPGSKDHPLLDLDVLFSPRRNTNVEVNVISYHPQRAELVNGRAETGGSPLSSPPIRQKQATTRRGKPSKGRYTGNSGAQTSPSKKPVLTFHIDGLTNEQAKAKARAIAKDIAKRQVVITGKIEGLPAMQVHGRVDLRQGNLDLASFAGRDYTVSNVTHTYNFPTGGRSEAGFTTEFTAMTGGNLIGGP